MKETVWDGRAKWREIAQELNIYSNVVSFNIRNNDEEELSDVLSQWIQTGTATMIDLVRALRSDQVGFKVIAKELLLTKQGPLCIDQESLEAFTETLAREGNLELIQELVTAKGISLTGGLKVLHIGLSMHEHSSHCLKQLAHFSEW